MFQDLIDAVQRAVKPEAVEVGGETYTTQQLFRFPGDTPPPVLSVSKLQSIVDYITSGVDGVSTAVDAGIFIHVESPDRVSLNSYLRQRNLRDTLLVAKYEASRAFAFNQQYEPGEFITRLQAQFEQDTEREHVQRFVGSLASESSLRLQDDGVTQETAVKKGITTLSTEAFQNPVSLTPYRTFAEAVQPESKFILRLHRRDDESPAVSLHEAENDKWKIDAITNIATFFSGKVGNVPVIA